MPTLPGQEFGGDGGVDPELGVAGCQREYVGGESIKKEESLRSKGVYSCQFTAAGSLD